MIARRRGGRRRRGEESLKDNAGVRGCFEHRGAKVLASRGGGSFDLVMVCREEWEMSPGGDGPCR